MFILITHMPLLLCLNVSPSAPFFLCVYTTHTNSQDKDRVQVRVIIVIRVIRGTCIAISHIYNRHYRQKPLIC